MRCTPLFPSACVGKSHDQSVGLPRGLDPEKTAFGLSTIKGKYRHTHTDTHRHAHHAHTHRHTHHTHTHTDTHTQTHTHTDRNTQVGLHILTQDVICCAVLTYVSSDDCAGDMVSPQKSRAQVEKEAARGKGLYRKSHNDYNVGRWADTCSQECMPELHSLPWHHPLCSPYLLLPHQER